MLGKQLQAGTDGGDTDGNGYFGWVIANDTHVLFTGMGMSPGNQELNAEYFKMMLMNDTTVQNQVTMQQLSYILQNLEALHKENTYVVNKVNVAKE